MTWINKALAAVATIVGVAGVVVAAPLGFPAVVVAIATKVLVYGTTVGVIAAKVAPGHGTNAPAPKS
jgi:hypothetical protein